MRYIFVFIISFAFCHSWFLDYERVMPASIHDAYVLDVSGESVFIARLAEETAFFTPDGEIVRYPLHGTSWAYYVACGDSVLCFILDYHDTTASETNIVSQRIFPDYGGIRRARIPFICEEWYPVWSEPLGQIVIIATEDNSIGEPGDDYFLQQRNMHFLHFPGMNHIGIIHDTPLPHQPYNHGEYLIVPMQQAFYHSNRFSEERDSTWAVDFYYSWYLDAATFDTIKTVYHGYKGSFEVNDHASMHSGRFRRYSNSLVMGESSVDVNGDGFVDLPVYKTQHYSYREPFGYEMSTYTVTIEAGGITIDSSGFIDDFSYLYLGRLIPGEDKALVTGERYYYGSRLEHAGTFDEPRMILSRAFGFFDFDGDGVEELFGIWGDTIGFYEIDNREPNTPILRGWNMISPPVQRVAVSDIVPFAEGPVYAFNPVTRIYEAADSLMGGTGYFMLSAIDTLIEWHADTIEAIHFSLQPGWNLIGAFTQWKHKRVLFDIPGILLSPYLFDPQRAVYYETDFLMPGKGYMIFCNEPIDTVIVR